MMTPQQIRECRLHVQHQITAEGRRGHKPDRLIEKCLPEALDEVERLRKGLADVIGLLLGGVENVEVATFEGDLVSAAVYSAKRIRSDIEGGVMEG